MSLAVAEAAWAASIPYAVFSLVPGSILKDAPGSVSFHDLSPLVGRWGELHRDFVTNLEKLSKRSNSPIAILPSEDGSLRLLNEWRDDILEFGEFPRARELKMGGLDKAEVIEHLDASGFSIFSGQSKVLYSPSDASCVFETLGADVVFKPALKPLSMDLSGLGKHGVKVVTQSSMGETKQSVMQRLEKAWPASSRWLAQPRLQIGPGLERSVCAARGVQISACQVTEQAKFPRMGGTALWVKTENKTDLIRSATDLLEILDVIGICEISFLPDKQGNYQLIELNPRPWLQVGLIEFSGFPIISNTVSALRGVDQNATRVQTKNSDWIHLERTALALASRQLSIRQFLNLAACSFHKDTMLSGYNSKFPGMKFRIATRSIRKLFF